MKRQYTDIELNNLDIACNRIDEALSDMTDCLVDMFNRRIDVEDQLKIINSIRYPAEPLTFTSNEQPAVINFPVKQRIG